MARRLPLLVLALAPVVLGLTAGPAAAAGPTNDPESASQWGLTDINAPGAWAKSQGGNIKVAVVSSGIARHPDLVSKTDGGFDATGGDPTSDTSGRGTHLAGIVGAATRNSVGIAGVAPDARVLPYKAFESDASISNSRFQAALQGVLSDRPQVALIDVPDSFPADARDGLHNALKTLADAGIAVVVGAQGGLSLGDLPILAVTAYDSGGAQAGPNVTDRGVAGPGVNVRSTTVTPPLLPGGDPTYGYGDLSGTGQAAAHVAGAAAILRSLGASSGQAADLLRSTARKGGGAGLGAGRIDVAAAVAAYKAAPPTPGATTTTTKKAAAKPGSPKGGTGPGGIPTARPLPGATTGPALPGDAVEPGAGEPAVTPPGLDQLADAPAEAGATVTTTGGRDKPLGLLAVGFGLLFGVGTGLSVTLRRMAGAPL